MLRSLQISRQDMDETIRLYSARRIQESIVINGVHDHEMLRDIRWAVKAVNQSFGNRFICLMQAMAGKTILNRRSVPNTLVLGAKISRVVETNYNEGMSAHAWLWAGGIILLGGEAREDFLPVTSYQSQ